MLQHRLIMMQTSNDNPTLNGWERASAAQIFAACLSRTTPEDDRPNSLDTPTAQKPIADKRDRHCCGTEPEASVVKREGATL
jgi:hypothetical protein